MRIVFASAVLALVTGSLCQADSITTCTANGSPCAFEGGLDIGTLVTVAPELVTFSWYLWGGVFTDVENAIVESIYSDQSDIYFVVRGGAGSGYLNGITTSQVSVDGHITGGTEDVNGNWPPAGGYPEDDLRIPFTYNVPLRFYRNTQGSLRTSSWYAFSHTINWQLYAPTGGYFEEVAPVPEPSALVLTVCGILGLQYNRRRQRYHR